MSVVGLDIGGANIKASDGQKSLSRPFPLWKHPEKLSSELEDVLKQFHPYGPIAFTMTGELADCFRTRAEGVREIVHAVHSAATKRQIYIWQTGGEFFSPEEAVEFPELVAAANWHALATWAGRACPTGFSILIDIGSTTTDIIPIEDGVPIPTGRTDLERLGSGELVYQGVRRTPLCAVTNHIELNGINYSLAAEVFATTLDIALLLGDVEEQPENCDTANSRPATKEEAQHRLARMLCSDCDQLSLDDLIAIANQIRDRQILTIADGLQKVISNHKEPSTIILTGEGEYLTNAMMKEHFPDLLQLEMISLNTILSADHSSAACAYALTKLGNERL